MISKSQVAGESFLPRWRGLFIILSQFAILCFFFVPSICEAQFQNVEPDARIVPWSSIRRLALEGGLFLPSYRPVSEAELARLLADINEEFLSGEVPALNDESEYSRLKWLLETYLYGQRGASFHGCECKEHPPSLRLHGKLIGGFSELGNPLGHEAGLSFAAGFNLFNEISIDYSVGRFWSACGFRFGGRVADGGISFSQQQGSSDPLTWPGWSHPTGRATVGDARSKGGAWTGQMTRALVGAQLGNWAISAGWDQRRTGPGLTGGINLDYQGRSFPALTARRTRSFQWQGFMTHLAPDETLFRAGVLSHRKVYYNDIYGLHSKDDNPWFFQWLVGWNVTSWFRTNFTHTVMATARDGSLWPDLLQINFPVIGTTWRESDSGPMTDRIFAVQFEFRWRDAPWPLLPSSAGRVFWDYGGTDFLPSGPGGLIPQISIPATVAGFELMSPRWDLGFEYAEFQHDKVLWYSNGGYRDGYTQELWLMGHPLGGSGESFTGLVRLRPAGFGFETGIQAKFASWGMPRYTPGTGEVQSLALSFRRTPRKVESLEHRGRDTAFLWEIIAEVNHEKVDPMGHWESNSSNSEKSTNWWRLIFKVGI